ncbi:molybdopterin converting factor subunit 1 [Candidatus Entotheonella serta]|nr:molybdopterin converting factor subunit 1 [Candidatus Entotheonella serta]
MHIHVKLFALLREIAGTDSVTLDVPEASNAGQALDKLIQQHPALQPYLDKVRLALKMDFVDMTASLEEGDELHLIPPVSGGV